MAEALLAKGATVVGVGSLNAYYDPALKAARLARFEGGAGFTFHRQDLAQREEIAQLFEKTRPGLVIHLAAQTGVHYSFDHPAISLLERALGREAKKIWLPLQPGDVPETCADVDDLARDIGYRPSTPLEEGIDRFVRWYRDYYRT